LGDTEAFDMLLEVSFVAETAGTVRTLEKIVESFLVCLIRFLVHLKTSEVIVRDYASSIPQLAYKQFAQTPETYENYCLSGH